MHQIERTVPCGGTGGHIIGLGQGAETIFPVSFGGGWQTCDHAEQGRVKSLTLPIPLRTIATSPDLLYAQQGTETHGSGYTQSSYPGQ